jgi:4-amino-4-deoxy-L-arabinose transferase-like glycosyltransferase
VKLSESTVEMLHATGRHRRVWLIAFICIVAIRLWVTPLSSSLGLDETGTYWTIQPGLSEIGSRSYSPPQSMVYFFIAGLAVALGGASEVVLRLPSVIAMGLAAFLLYRLGKRLLGADAALWATLVFVCSQDIAYAASDARAYALAVLATIVAVLFLVRWLESGRYTDGLSYAVFASLTVYLHYLFAVMFLVHALCAIYAFKKLRAVRPWGLFTIGVLIGVLLLPILPGLAKLVSNGSIYDYASDPDVSRLFQMLSPAVLTGSILAGLLLASFVPPAGQFSPPLKRPGSILLLVLWAGLPPLLLFAFSKVTPFKVFVPHYMLCHLPGLALLAGWALQGIQPAHKQVIVAASLFIGSLTAFGSLRHVTFPHTGENWRDAIGAAASIARGTHMPVLVGSGFKLPVQQALYSDAFAASRFLAPVSRYPIAGDVIPLPYRPDRETEPYLQNLATNTLEHADRFLLLARANDGLFAAWLEGRFAGSFVSKPIGDFGAVSLTLFQRNAKDPPGP